MQSISATAERNCTLRAWSS